MSSMSLSSENVSSLIVVRNYEAFIDEALRSLLAQTHRAQEILVIDDGSSDRTAERVKAYSEVRYVYQEKAGTAVARNRAIRLSSGEFFHFLDADDVAPETRIESLLAAFREDSSLDLTYGLVQEFREADGKRVFQEAKAGRVLGAMMLRRTAFERVGYFDERLEVADVADWVLRAGECSLKERSLDKLVLYRRLHADNTSLRKREILQREWGKVMMASIRRKRGEGS